MSFVRWRCLDDLSRGFGSLLSGPLAGTGADCGRLCPQGGGGAGLGLAVNGAPNGGSRMALWQVNIGGGRACSTGTTTKRETEQ